MEERFDNLEKNDTQHLEKRDFFSLQFSNDFKEYCYSAESQLMPFLDTVLFIADLIPVLFICNLLSSFQYTGYDEIIIEAECVNRAFEGYRLLFYKDGTEQVTNVVGVMADLGQD